MRVQRSSRSLSSGTDRSVRLASAVAKRPDLLLCDEPTGALDYKTGVKVLEVIARVNQELGTSTAIITHNAPVAQMAQRVVSLHDGLIQSEKRNDTPVSASEIRW